MSELVGSPRAVAWMRYQTDPVYHHTIELLVRVAIDAVERADAQDQPTRSQWEQRRRLLTEALVGLDIPRSLGVQPEDHLAARFAWPPKPKP